MKKREASEDVKWSELTNDEKDIAIDNLTEAITVLLSHTDALKHAIKVLNAHSVDLRTILEAHGMETTDPDELETHLYNEAFSTNGKNAEA